MTSPAARTRRRRRRRGATIGFAVVIGLLAVTAACRHEDEEEAAPARTIVIGARTLGGLAMSPDTSFRAMRSFFPSPASESFGPGWCRLEFRNLGLDASFRSLSVNEGVGTPATCEFFVSAVATTRAWRTTKGVGAGTTLRALRRAYPRAYRGFETGGEIARIVGRATVWELTQASGHSAQTILVAYVKRGRVVALGIDTVGH